MAEVAWTYELLAAPQQWYKNNCLFSLMYFTRVKCSFAVLVSSGDYTELHFIYFMWRQILFSFISHVSLSQKSARIEIHQN